MENRINVGSRGDRVSPIGYISGQSGMQIKFQGFPPDVNLTLTSMNQDIANATGVGGVEYKDYSFNTYISESGAVAYGWPTGNGSRKFGHSGQTAGYGPLAPV